MKSAPGSEIGQQVLKSHFRFIFFLRVLCVFRGESGSLNEK